MVFAHRPLEQDEAGPGAWRVIGPDAPAPLRGMVARGLAPLPPRDLLVALYQIWVSNDPDLAPVSAKTIEGLPMQILGGALDDVTLPGAVLDLLGRRLPRNAEVLERVVRHRRVDDETLSSIARVCPETVCDVISDNQERWLRHPKIVEALYQNPHCRMSVIHRMLELAVRENVDVRLPNMDEIRQALLEGSTVDESRDAVFKQVTGGAVAQHHEKTIDRLRDAAAHEELDLDRVIEDSAGEADLDRLLAQAASDDLMLPLEAEGEAEAAPAAADKAQLAAAAAAAAATGDGRFVMMSKLKPMEKIRLALLGTTYDRFVLIRDSNKAVSMSAIKSPKVNDQEVIAYAANRTLARDIIGYISKRREWTKLYQVTMNLTLNPKTPMASAMGFLTRLYPHDVKKVAFSKNIPSALATAARRKLEQRK
ncbi:MAG: hypothetical protein IAG13_36475 [Deltaproteobacteria bacterium]|nr:hypothetical protein [Nannocystaceae bacterium]